MNSDRVQKLVVGNHIHTVPEGGKHTTVRLTKEAHALLRTRAKGAKVSMKEMASEAIFTLDRAPKRERMLVWDIEQLKLRAKKFKQVVIVEVLLVCLGVGLLRFFFGVVV